MMEDELDDEAFCFASDDEPCPSDGAVVDALLLIGLCSELTTQASATQTTLADATDGELYHESAPDANDGVLAALRQVAQEERNGTRRLTSWLELAAAPQRALIVENSAWDALKVAVHSRGGSKELRRQVDMERQRTWRGRPIVVVGSDAAVLNCAPHLVWDYPPRCLAERAADAVAAARAEGRSGPRRECTAEETEARLVAVLRRTTRASTSYCAARFPAGYHTWRLPLRRDGASRELRGERDPSTRFAALAKRADFTLDGKRVLDIGCNQGAMLINAAASCGCSGVGVDFDSELINACTRMARHYRVSDRCAFYTFDVDAAAEEASALKSRAALADADTTGRRGAGGGANVGGGRGRGSATASAHHFAGLNRIHTFLDGAGGVDVIFLLAVCQWCVLLAI